MKPFKRTYTKQEQKQFEFLSKNKLFSNLNKKEMQLFLPYLHLRLYQENEVVFFRNDPSQALYLIKEGEVTLKLDINDRFENITTIEKQASFGNNALLPKARRVYNAIVSSGFCEIYVIPQVNMIFIFEGHALIKSKMMQSLAEVFNTDFGRLLKAYQSTHGFFDLAEMFANMEYGA